MTPQLSNLMQEICAGVEVFFTGRHTAAYLNSAFILCDDYTELTSKLFLVHNLKGWTDDLGSGRYKDYKTVLNDVYHWFQANRKKDEASVHRLVEAMKQRRERRNIFFHSTHLLDLNVRPIGCIEAFCDLLAYGALLFGKEWEQAVAQTANLDTLEIILLLERHAAADPKVAHSYRRIVDEFGAKVPKPGKTDTYTRCVGEDFYFRLTVIHGSSNLKAQLRALLPP